MDAPQFCCRGVVSYPMIRQICEFTQVKNAGEIFISFKMSQNHANPEEAEVKEATCRDTKRDCIWPKISSNISFIPSVKRTWT